MEKMSPKADDPIALLQSLTVEDVSKRLEDLYAEEKSLRIILRSLRARETAAKRKGATTC